MKRIILCLLIIVCSSCRLMPIEEMAEAIKEMVNEAEEEE